MHIIVSRYGMRLDREERLVGERVEGLSQSGAVTTICFSVIIAEVRAVDRRPARP